MPSPLALIDKSLKATHGGKTHFLPLLRPFFSLADKGFLFKVEEVSMSSSLAASALGAATSGVDLGRLVTSTGAVRTLNRKLIGSVNKAGARRPRVLGTGFTGTGIGSAEVPATEDVSETEAASAAAEPRSL